MTLLQATRSSGSIAYNSSRAAAPPQTTTLSSSGEVVLLRDGIVDEDDWDVLTGALDRYSSAGGRSGRSTASAAAAGGTGAPRYSAAEQSDVGVTTAEATETTMLLRDGSAVASGDRIPDPSRASVARDPVVSRTTATGTQTTPPRNKQGSAPPRTGELTRNSRNCGAVPAKPNSCSTETTEQDPQGMVHPRSGAQTQGETYDREHSSVASAHKAAAARRPKNFGLVAGSERPGEKRRTCAYSSALLWTGVSIQVGSWVPLLFVRREFRSVF